MFEIINEFPESARRVLVVGAHPDDETLGPGGTLRRHALAGDAVYALCLCENMSLRYGQAEQAGFDTAVHLREAARTLGFAGLQIVGFPDQRLDEPPIVEVIRPIERAVKELRPGVVYTHWWGDLNRDHKVVYEATLVACRFGATSVERLLAYETPSSTEIGVPYNFSPNYFVDITATLEDKKRAIACYSSEMQAYPGPRSPGGLEDRARTWGQGAGMAAAEPFHLLRSYWR